MLDKPTTQKIKNIFNSSFTLRILAKIQAGYRPTNIADQLKITPQRLHYHTDKLIESGLIRKNNDSSWSLTQKGSFILKQFLSRSVNNNNNSTTMHRLIAARIHNLSFSFDILSFDENKRLRWIPINNGVLKCFIKYPNHTLEITKSPSKGESVLMVHLSEAYTYDPLIELLKQYDLARHYVSLAAERLRLDISDNGKLVKRPHLAFEGDLIAMYLATFQTAGINTEKGKDKAWIDASQGLGELETNDVDYAYKYLTMPENIFNIYEDLGTIKRKLLSGYSIHYDPILTDNN
jgi:predicted transcriptional regulator